MHYSSILLAASAALVSSQAVPDDYEWDVIGWSAGCARTCSYSFNISGPAVPPYPSFAATCSGYDTGAFSDCVMVDYSWNNGGGVSVNSLVAPSTGDGAHLQVSLFFNSADGLGFYNVTGAEDADFNHFSRPADDFEIDTCSFVVLTA